MATESVFGPKLVSYTGIYHLLCMLLTFRFRTYSTSLKHLLTVVSKAQNEFPACDCVLPHRRAHEKPFLKALLMIHGVEDEL